jgi:methionine synthase I (cobalamin-dependent)
LLDTREKLLDIREKLDGRLLVGDGALGTLLADRGIDQPYYKANLTHADIVQAVHEEYLRAGARVIEINTFLANSHKLAELSKEDAPKYGVEVAQNLLVEAKPLVGGAYLMPPASMPHLAGDVIEPIV